MPGFTPAQTVRVELHGPGTTLAHRRSMPVASTEFRLTDATPTDPNALPTLTSATNGARFTAPGVLLVTVSGSGNGFVYCAVGPTPNPSADPRHSLTDGSFLIDIGDKDRVSFAARSY